MKTFYYLPTLLALIIHVMINGQTQKQQDLDKKINFINTKEPVKMNYANSNITLTLEEYNKLISQVDRLKLDASQLKEEARIAELNYFDNKNEASRLTEQISLQEFKENKKVILVFLSKIDQYNNLYNKVIAANNESIFLMHLAKEMRESVNAQLTLQEKIENLNNAEEEELMACRKQREILNIIENSLNSNDSTCIKNKKKGDLHFMLSLNKPIDTNSQNIEYVRVLLSEAESQSNSMKTTAKLLRDKAVIATPNEKLVLINEASSLEKEQISKLVEISNLRANLTYSSFINNRSIISDFINSEKSDTKILFEVSQLFQDAEKLMQMAKEMREEANAQVTVYAKYGAISNTEEMETSAIDKQNKSIQLIDTVKINTVIASR